MNASKKSTPSWYTLSWQPSPPAIRIGLHRNVISQAGVITSTSPVVENLQQRYKLGNFSNDFTHNFGFAQALKGKGWKGDWFTIEAALPTTLLGYTKCQSCQGTGKDMSEVWGDFCRRCNGKGKLPDYSWEKVTATAASLSLLFEYLQWWYTQDSPELQTGKRDPQLLTVNIALQPGGPGSRPIWGTFNHELVQWLLKVGDIELPTVLTAMQQAYRRFMGALDKYDRHRFNANLERGNYLVACPGSACGIHPSPHALSNITTAYEFTCHNVDTSIQQLTLLAGLAALCDLARSEMK